ncbi:MAG: DNA alkylation repair protein [Planctomycetota bacterium]
MTARKHPSVEQLRQWSTRPAPRRRSEVPNDVLIALREGWIESKNLVEWLVVDRIHLLHRLAESLQWCLDAEDRKAIAAIQSLSALKQSQEIGRWLVQHSAVGDASYQKMVTHTSDVVREWSAFLVGAAPGLTFAKRLAWLKTHADDSNAGTREIAWLALRPLVIEDPVDSVRRLVPWTGSRNERLRRFASEITRPCGVWCSHIPLLKAEPEIGMPILDPLASDESRYVGNSVANWLNDASKSQPDWVRRVTRQWQSRSPTPETERIVRRALRTIGLRAK